MAATAASAASVSSGRAAADWRACWVTWRSCSEATCVRRDERSNVGRLGIDIHATAGKGDVGFCNHWTLEISVSVPVRVYPGMPIGQLIYFAVQGDVATFYNRKPSAKYNRRSDRPVESMMWQNTF